MSEPTRADLRRTIHDRDATIARMEKDPIRADLRASQYAVRKLTGDIAAKREEIATLTAERDKIIATLNDELDKSSQSLRRAGVALNHAGIVVDDLNARLMRRTFWPKWAEFAMFTVASGIGLADLFMLAVIALGHHGP